MAERREILLYELAYCNETRAFFTEKGCRIVRFFLFLIQCVTIFRSLYRRLVVQQACIDAPLEQVLKRQSRERIGFFRGRQDVRIVSDRVGRDQ